ETLLLEGLPSDYETVSTVISMSDETNSNSVRGLLRQRESELRARKQAKKEQAVLFAAVQQSLQQSSSSSSNPRTRGSRGGRGRPRSGGNSKNEEPAPTTPAAVKEPATTKCSRCGMEHGRDRCPKSERSSERALVTAEAPEKEKKKFFALTATTNKS